MGEAKEHGGMAGDAVRDELAKLPGLKERDLVALGRCVICGEPQLGFGVTFYKITIERAGFDARAVTRAAGLQMMLGSAALAAHMGPDEDIAKVFSGPHCVFVHEHCAGKIHHLLQLTPEKPDEC